MGEKKVKAPLLLPELEGFEWNGMRCRGTKEGGETGVAQPLSCERVSVNVEIEEGQRRASNNRSVLPVVSLNSS